MYDFIALFSPFPLLDLPLPSLHLPPFTLPSPFLILPPSTLPSPFLQLPPSLHLPLFHWQYESGTFIIRHNNTVYLPSGQFSTSSTQQEPTVGGFLWWHILLIAVAAVAVLVAIVAVIFVSPQSILCVAVTKYILCWAVTKYPCIGASEACMVLVNLTWREGGDYAAHTYTFQPTILFPLRLVWCACADAQGLTSPLALSTQPQLMG